MVEQITCLLSATQSQARLQRLAAALDEIGITAIRDGQGYTALSKRWTPQQLAKRLDEAGVARDDYRLTVEYFRSWGYL